MKLPSSFVRKALKDWENDLACTPTEMEKKSYVDGLMDGATFWKKVVK